jgi:hypothetical protein
VRVRQFELRLLAVALTVLWAAGGGIVLIAYRPGGPIDVAVGIAASLPLLLSLAAVVWPPLTRDDRIAAVIFALGLGAALLLVPSIANVAAQVVAGGPQPLLPSLEVVYPWALALAATSLFAGLGVSRRLVRASGFGKSRITTTVGFAFAATALIALVFSGVTLADEAALRDRPAVYSRFGPTSADLVPPECNAALVTPSSAKLSLQLWADVDGRSVGNIDISGVRSGGDFSWTAQVVRGRDLFVRYASARVGARAWLMGPDGHWTEVPAESVDSDALDAIAVARLLAPGNRATAENRGFEYVEGARARHCRITADGETFVASFPQEAWLLGAANLGTWRGELNYWVFGDGEVGRIEGSLNGEAQEILPHGLLATINVRLTATERDSSISLPTPNN